MFAEATVLDILLALIGTFGALATSGAAIAAAIYAHKAHVGVKEATPVIKAINETVNGAEGGPTIAENVRASRERDEAADAAAEDTDAPTPHGAADRAAGATADGAEETEENP